MTPRPFFLLGAVAALLFGGWLTTRPTATAPVDTVPVVAATPDVESRADSVAQTTTATTSTTAPTTDCSAEDARLCPDFYKAGIGLAPVANWQEVAAEKGYVCADDAGNAGNPTPSCASAKLAGRDCLDQLVALRSPDCTDYTDWKQELNDVFVAACRYTTAKGGVCEGKTPAPPAEPLVDCVEEHIEVVTPDCAKAWTSHHEAKGE